MGPTAIKEPRDRTAGGPDLRPGFVVEVREPPFARRLLAETRWAWVWLPVRLYLGGGWLLAGVAKLQDPAWMSGARLAVVPGRHFLQVPVLSHPSLWAHAVAWSQVVLGAAVVCGALTGVCAFLGGLIATDFLLSGGVAGDPWTVSVGVALILAWRVAGWWGLDRWILPALACPLRRRSG